MEVESAVDGPSGFDVEDGLGASPLESAVVGPSGVREEDGESSWHSCAEVGCGGRVKGTLPIRSSGEAAVVVQSRASVDNSGVANAGPRLSKDME